MKMVFRTEANHKQGMGDLWGSIALADQCQRKTDEVLFVLSNGTMAREILKKRGYPFVTTHSWAKEKNLLSRFSPDVIVVNKLNNPGNYIKSLKALKTMVVTLDDAGEAAKWADLKINVLYPIPGALSDFRFLSLRREFHMARMKNRSTRSTIHELLVLQGGSDTYGFLPKIIEALNALTIRPHCTIVAGPALKHMKELRRAVAKSVLAVDVISNASHIEKLMLGADLAVTAGGLTMYELACVGTPSIIVCAEPFEVGSAARMQKAGAVLNLGFGGSLNYSKIPKAVEDLAGNRARREFMASCGKRIVDGKGAERIVHLIRTKILPVSRGRA